MPWTVLRSSDACVCKAAFCHVCGVVDVAQVNDDIALEHVFHAGQVQRAELVPFR